MSAITARHHPRTDDVGTCSAWCDRPAEHEGLCLSDDEREMRLDGVTWARPEGSTVDVRTGELW